MSREEKHTHKGEALQRVMTAARLLYVDEVKKLLEEIETELEQQDD